MEANSIVCVVGSLILHHQSWLPVVATRFTLITIWFRLKAIRTRPTPILIIIIFINIIIIIITMITFWFRSKAIRTRGPHLCGHVTSLFHWWTFNIGLHVIHCMYVETSFTPLLFWSLLWASESATRCARGHSSCLESLYIKSGN